MKPHLLKIPLQSEHSFNIRYDVVPHFYDKWHYHAEIELVYILRGSGTQFTGDNIHHFNDNDMMLLGANLPHLWKSDERFLRKGSKLKVEALVLHFMPDCMGEHFFNLPENKDLGKLLQKAEQGIRVAEAARKKVGVFMQELLTAHKSDRIILLIRILKTIANAKQNEPLSSKRTPTLYSPTETDRLNTIYQYVLNNFSGAVTLEQVAAVAHLTPHAFCRYFKSRTNKTFSRFLLEVRIGHACNLLADTNKGVAEICYESGFNNFSNFNRHFKSITGLTPLAHKKLHREPKSD